MAVIGELELLLIEAIRGGMIGRLFQQLVTAPAQGTQLSRSVRSAGTANSVFIPRRHQKLLTAKLIVQRLKSTYDDQLEGIRKATRIARIVKMAWHEFILGSATQDESGSFVAELDRSIKHFEDLSAAILTALTSPPAESPPIDPSGALRQLAHAPLTQGLDTLARIAPIGVRSSIRSTSNDVVEFCRTLESVERPDLPDLASVLSSVDTFVGRLRRARISAVHHRTIKRLLTRTIVIISATVTALAGIWLNARHGFAVHSQTVLFPRGPHASPPNDCELTTTPENIDDYLTDFSEYYFHGTGRYPYFFWERTPPWFIPDSSPDVSEKVVAPASLTGAPVRGPYILAPPHAVVRAPLWKPSPDPHAVRLKFTLQNVSIWNVEAVSTVTIRAQLVQLARFPWHRLDYAPDVECILGSNAGLTLVNHGLGRVRNLTCSLDTPDGQRLVQTSHQFRYENGVTFPVHISARCLYFAELSCSRMDGYMSVGLVKRADGQWELANAIDALIWQSDGTTVPKAILTLGDLKKNADVVQGGRATINVEYSAINGLRYKHSIDVDLPEFIAYYQFKPEKYSAVKPTCAAPAPTDAMFFLAAALHPPTINAESADHTITLESEFNMKDVGLGESREESLAVDKRLSPRGTVNWEILLKDPAGGTYELTFVVNDMPVGVSRVHCFRAERLGYHTEEHEIIDECLNRAPPAVAPAPPAP